jgi:hypothetical protein
VEEVPVLLREMFKISHLKVSNGKILHADGQELERFMPKEFRSNYTQHLASTLENSMKANPELFSGDFEFLLMNKDTLHESYLYE